jgi:hypothetical protein
VLSLPWLPVMKPTIRVEEPPPQIPETTLNRIHCVADVQSNALTVVPFTVCFCGFERRPFSLAYNLAAEIDVLGGPEIAREYLVCSSTARCRFVPRCVVLALTVVTTISRDSKKDS